MRFLPSIPTLQKIFLVGLCGGLVLIAFYQTLYNDRVIKIDIMHRLDKIKRLEDRLIQVSKMSTNRGQDLRSDTDNFEAEHQNTSSVDSKPHQETPANILSICATALGKLETINWDKIDKVLQGCQKIFLTQKSTVKPTTKQICTRKDHKIVGPLFVNKTPLKMEELYSGELGFVKEGGRWSPHNCTAATKTAIVIPFRDRQEHLGILLRQLLPILRRQLLSFQIFVVEQADDHEFNRGKLMNVGFAEATAADDFTCFVFHDVDLVPEDDRIDYGCHASPQHLSVAVDKFKYKLPYEKIFGGVEMFTTNHFRMLNGFSNSFWGWGAEDDNLFYRLTKSRMTLWRQSPKIARYTMLKHNDNELSANQKRFFNLKRSKEYISTDGLNTLKYRVIETKLQPLYTLIRADLLKLEDRMFGVLEKFTKDDGSMENADA